MLETTLTPPLPNPSLTDDLKARVAALPLPEKVELLTGKTHWRTYAAAAIGLREVVMSDGPTGIRGEEEIPDEESLSLPCPSAVAATWDTELAKKAGSVHAAEARRHGVDVILAPVVNLQRTPLGGRHFEAQSEDPLLSAEMACAVISGIQDEGVAACVKHLVGNESETLRTEYVSRIDPRTLREVYLAPFERAVKDAHSWSIMASYNRLDDGTESAQAVAHHNLLTRILKDEWGYDGEVISDWTATKTTVEPALGGLDLVMPGPAGPWSRGQLLAAVERGDVPEAFVDDKVCRLLLLASRVGALDGYEPPQAAHLVADADADALVRTIAGRCVVVLADQDESLPAAGPLTKIAVVGPNAVEPYIQGGGSSNVKAAVVQTAAGAFAEAFPGAEIEVAAGASSKVLPRVADPAAVTDPVTGLPGVHVQALAGDGTVLAEETRPQTDIFWRGDLPSDTVRVRLTADLALAEEGKHWVGIGTPGACRISVDDAVVFESSDQITGGEVFLRSLHRNTPFHGVEVAGPGTAHVEADVQYFTDGNWDAFVRAVVFHEIPGPTPKQQIAEAVGLATAADLAVVIVGTNSEVESEGWDRENLDLPGNQNDLVEAVLAARPDAIVVLNAGAPVVLPWLDRARTVLWSWFPGQEGARGVADVIAGRTEPAGRLPWTLPADLADVPVQNGIAVSADVPLDYTEGVDIGYRGWLRAGKTPARPFGFGLGWTRWQYGEPRIVSDDGDVILAVDVTNIGPRSGHEMVQGYLEFDAPSDSGETPVWADGAAGRPPEPGSSPDCTSEGTSGRPGPAGVLDGRPVRWLAGFAGVDADPGQTATAVVTIRRRAFEIWDGDGWTTPKGAYRLVVAHDVLDDRGNITIER